jgi:hypothetical protein
MAEQRAVAWAVCDAVAILGHGNIVAVGSPQEVFANPTFATLGIEEPAEVRLRRRLAEAGLEPSLLDSAS